MSTRSILGKSALTFVVAASFALAACTTEAGDIDPDVSVADDGVDPSACPRGRLCVPPTPPIVFQPSTACGDVCSTTSYCGESCDGPSGPSTCGGFGRCEACSDSICSSPFSCARACVGPSGLTSCTAWSGAARADADLDGLPDAFETALAQKFYPNLNMHCGSYEGYAHGSKGQFYGSDVRCGNAPGAELPFVVRKVGPLANGWCAEGECIEVVYGLAYASDLGDDRWGGGHRGDSEMYATLLAWKKPSVGYEGNEFRTAGSFAEALTSASHWARIKDFAAAHMCAGDDSSEFLRPRYLSNGLKEHAVTPSYLWVAEGKNATYLSQSACNSGSDWDRDDCTDNRCTLDRAVGVAKLKNSGELLCHPQPAFDPVIIDAAPSVGTCGAANGYNVWSGMLYGGASSFAVKLDKGIVDWGRDTFRCD